MIAMNDFRRQWQDTGESVLAAVAAVGESGWYITGAELSDFERELAAVWTVRWCAGVASGLDAIELSLRALGCQAGDRVLTTPLSSFATTLAILKLGAIPVFADTDDFGLIDLDECERLLAARPDVRFMVPVHLYGNAIDLERLDDLKQRFELTVVEDCAQSILATHRGRMTGTVGQMAATSFYPTKNLGAPGDGGAVLTNDEELSAAVKSLRDYGRSGRYSHDRIGYNSRLDEVHAAVLRRAYLPRLSDWTARRRAVAARYRAGIRNPAIRILGAPEASDPCFHLFAVMAEPSRKQDLLEHLERNGVGAGQHYPILIPDQRAMAGARYEAAGRLSRAGAIAAGEVSLPIHPYITAEEVDCVIAICNRWEG